MRYVRLIVLAAMLLSGVVLVSRLWATDNNPALSEGDKKKIKAYCQHVFDNTVDDCLKNPGRYAHADGGANCTQVAGEMWAQCMRQHGIDVMAARAPGMKNPPMGHRPEIGTASPTPNKRKVIDSGAVTTVKPASTPTPTPTPFRTPRPSMKTGSSPTPKKG